MEYFTCKYCGRLFLRKSKLQKYHKKCKKPALEENIKRYHKRDEIRDRNNFNSLIRRLNKKEKEYKEKMEKKYLEILITLKKIEPQISIDKKIEVEQNEDDPKDYFKKEIKNIQKLKRSIEESEAFNKIKIEILNKLTLSGLQEKLKRLE